MTDLVIRFLVGGGVVATFALLGDLFKPKSFAGVFAGAPSVALATLGMAALQSGAAYAAVEARSMVVGGAAFFVYAAAVSWTLSRRGGRPRVVAAKCAWLWFAVAAAGWALWLRVA